GGPPAGAPPLPPPPATAPDLLADEEPRRPGARRPNDTSRTNQAGKPLANSGWRLMEMVDISGLRSRWDRMSEPRCHAWHGSPRGARTLRRLGPRIPASPALLRASDHRRRVP